MFPALRTSEWESKGVVPCEWSASVCVQLHLGERHARVHAFHLNGACVHMGTLSRISEDAHVGSAAVSVARL